MKLSSTGFSSPLFSFFIPLCLFLLNLREMLDILLTGNNPPLYEIFLHYWIKAFGIEPWAVRMPSLIFSALTAPVIYRIGQRYATARAGVIAAAIFTISTMHIYFSHEARVYSLFVLLATLSLYFYLGIAREPGRKRNYVLLFITNLVLIYSHYFGFFVLLVELVSLPLIEHRRRAVKGVLVMMAALAVCYTPMIVVFLQRAQESVEGTWVSAPAITEVYGNLNRFLNNKYNTLVLIILFAGAFTARILKKDLARHIKAFRGDRNIMIILLWFGVPYLLMFIVSFKVPMFIDRYILYTSIPFYLVIGILISRFVNHTIFQGIAAGIFLLSMVLTMQINPDNDRRMREWVEEVKSRKSPGTLVLLAPGYADIGFAYHYNIEYFKDYKRMRQLLNGDNIFPINSADAAEQQLKRYNGDCIYLEAGTEFIDPENRILKTLAARYKNHEQFFVYKIYFIHRFY
jgi:mannosyltransferase